MEQTEGSGREMKIGQALSIFMDIDSNEHTVQEKGEAIYKVLHMPTHNGVTKDMMLKVIWWLFRLIFEPKDGDGE